MQNMASNKLAIWFVQEIVIGFGFFTGFWILVGVDPEALMVNSILDAFKAFSGSMASTLSFYYWLFGVVFALVSIASSIFNWKMGRTISTLLCLFGWVTYYFSWSVVSTCRSLLRIRSSFYERRKTTRIQWLLLNES
jgi:hypothetical protein